ncbi:MAG: DUF3817 domain-containing protein [Micrococcaceae bacterium]
MSTNLNRQRKLAGTGPQIRSALKFYKFMAYFTGIFLLLLVLEMILKYGFHYEVIIGGLNLSMGVLIVHGWGYVVYLVSGFRLWTMMRWDPMKLLKIALGGVVPFLSFIVEKQVHAEAEAELASRGM